MKKYLLYGFVLASATVIGTAQPSHALLDLIRVDLSASQSANSQSSSNNADSNASGNANASDKTLELEQKRQAIQEKIDAHRAAIAEKLSGKRAEVCKEKEISINQSLNARTATAEKYFARFKTIEDRLTSFARNNKLDVDNAEALQLIMDDSRENAQALISTGKTTVFSCENTSATQPGEVVRSIVVQEKEALKKYRDAIKSYAEAVKAAALIAEQNNASTAQQTETEVVQ